MRLLLINPRFPESFWSFTWGFNRIVRDKKALSTPLGLCTIAALCPAHWEITIVDENVEPIDWDLEADIVGVCGMGVQFLRQKEILARFKEKGCYMVAGGSFASLCPEEYTGVADTVIAGEAESIWPQFCADFEKSVPQKLYQQTDEVDLTQSPVPRYDLIKTHLYYNVAVQFSRGCPFLCEFCDIIVMFGRKPRTKSLVQIERELDSLRALGISNVFFVDDNLIGHLPRCKELLTFLIDYQKRHRYRFTFGTEASINLAGQRGLLQLFHDAGFQWVFIGIESPSHEALLETKKTQNTREDLLQSVQTIYSYGIDVFAGFIVGFDADDATIFDRQLRFILDSGIILAAIGLLTAIPRTPLFERLQRDNRLLLSNQFHNIENNFAATNIVPLQMTYDQLIEGFQELQASLCDDKSIYQRITNKFRLLRDPSTPAHLSAGRIFLYTCRFLLHGAFPGGFRRLYYVFSTLLLALRNGIGLPVVMINWMFALSFREFCVNHVTAKHNQIRPRTNDVRFSCVAER